MLCTTCNQPKHFCINPSYNCGGEEGQIETGHYGTTPALYCDECRHLRIINQGYVGDEPISQQVTVLLLTTNNDTVH